MENTTNSIVRRSFKGDLLTILYNKLASTHDVTLLLQELNLTVDTTMARHLSEMTATLAEMLSYVDAERP